jgi:hypothetical protein
MFNGALCFRPLIVQTNELCGRIVLGLLRDVSNASDCAAQNGWVINVLEYIWKEVGAFQCKVLY